MSPDFFMFNCVLLVSICHFSKLLNLAAIIHLKCSVKLSRFATKSSL